MKTLILAMIFTLTAATFADAKPRQQKSVQVQVNHEKAVKGTPLTVKFIELVEDSRCPVDTTCVWAGNAKIKIRVTRRGSRPQTIELNTMQTGDAPVAHGYKLRLTGLTPKPRSNIRINRNGYVATISVQK